MTIEELITELRKFPAYLRVTIPIYGDTVDEVNMVETARVRWGDSCGSPGISWDGEHELLNEWEEGEDTCVFLYHKCKRKQNDSRQ